MTLRSVAPLRALTLSLLATSTLSAWADEATIRKNLAARIPGLPPIEEIRKTPVPGIYELRIGTEITYSDENGEHLLRGSLLTTADKRDLTAERVEKLLAIDFKTLPLKDAIVRKNGSGTRKMAVFADPNCGYCKRLEGDIAKLKDVTVYTILLPILSPDSEAKAKGVWCAKDRLAAWDAWMLQGKAPDTAPANCKTPIDSSLAFAKKYSINSTPTIFLENGQRFRGAAPAEELEKRLKLAAGK